jgi:hypothetical protein
MKNAFALSVKCPTCRSNPGVRCDGSSPCKARVTLAKGTPEGKVHALEKRVSELDAKLANLMKDVEMLKREAVRGMPLGGRT